MAKKNRVRSRRARARGFTLLEVMVALAIFATLAGAVMSASQYALRQNARLQEQIQSAWVADNQLSELRLHPASPGREQRLHHFNRSDWIVEQTITPAFDPRMLQVDISVSRVDSNQPIYHTTGWVPAHHE